MKLFKRTALAPFMALLVVASNTVPAHAAAAGAGTVLGHVTILLPASGITSTPAVIRWSFQGFRIVGALVAQSPPATGPLVTCAGLFTVTGVTGSGFGETTTRGSGSVSAAAFAGGGCPAGGTLRGGVYERVGPVVVVVLTGHVNGSASDFTVTIEALFIPRLHLLAGPTAGITGADFVGVFQAQ